MATNVGKLLLGLAGFIAAALRFGARRWRSTTRAMRTRLEAGRLPMEVKRYSADALHGLPAPVQRYFRAVLKDGQPMIVAVSAGHAGRFNLSETGARWRAFTSDQRVVTRRPGFDWEARIRIAPFLALRVHDAYIAGEGILHASLFGLLTLVNMRGTPEVAQGELMRFLAEAPWYPTALLPSQGVLWEAVDGNSARATLRDGEQAVSLLFRFDENGLIASARAEARGRSVGGSVVPTPWEGRWSRYEMRDGMRIPVEGEVAWQLPEGPKPYWRGHITRIGYEFAE